MKRDGKAWNPDDVISELIELSGKNIENHNVKV
jgi:hypothetical protein